MKLTNERIAEIIALDDASTRETRAMAVELRQLRALLATPMPCGWEVPLVDDDEENGGKLVRSEGREAVKLTGVYSVNVTALDNGLHRVEAICDCCGKDYSTHVAAPKSGSPQHVDGEWYGFIAGFIVNHGHDCPNVRAALASREGM